MTASCHRLLFAAIAGLVWGSACVSDVELPECVVNDSCGQAGEGESPSGGGSSSQAGSDPASGAPGAASGGGETGGAGGEAGGAGGESGFGGEGLPIPLCPECQIRPLELPAGCEGQPYETTILADLGTPPYQWQLTPPVAGWSVSSQGPSSARLVADSVSPGKTRITVMVTDGTGRRKTSTLSLLSRSSCWFAYTAFEKPGDGRPAQGQLRLVDPIDERLEIQPAHNESVHDFRFSPDGRHLAYSYGATPAAPRGRHLALIELESRHEEALSFGEDSLQAFAWSPDSSTLAVAFTTDGVTKLGGVRLPEAGLESTPVSLHASEAHVESELSWVGGELVAYHAQLLPKVPFDGTFVDNPLGLHTAFYSPLGPSGFGAEVPVRGAFPPGVELRPTGAGFFVISDGVPGTSFYPLVGTAGLGREHDAVSLISPSGKFSAILFDGLPPLTLQSAEQGSVGVPAAVAAEEDACDLVLAWAEGTERVACVTNVMNANETFHGEVRLFDLNEAGDALQMRALEGFCEDDTSLVTEASCLKAPGLRYSYDIDSARNAARAFSASGRWFAFTRPTERDGYLYLGEVGEQQATLARKLTVPATSATQPTALSFSRDERFLFVQAGDWLELVEVSGAQRRYPLAFKVDAGRRCTEEFTTEPDEYCGNTDRGDLVRWAPDSKSLAYRTPNALTVLDVTASSPGVHARVAPDCEQACSGHFAFQPR